MWRAESSEQSFDGYLGMWCHHSISKSDDEQGVFLSASFSVDYQTGSHRFFHDARSIQKQHMHSTIIRLSFKSLCHLRALDLISALAPWQPSPCREVYCCNDKVFNETLQICIQYMMYHCVAVHIMTCAFLQHFSYCTESLMENLRAGKESKINNLFYLMGWSVTVTR